MARQRHLSRAPIAEAIFDFRVKARPGLVAEQLQAARHQLAADFPIVEERRGFEFQVSTESKRSEVLDLGLQGYFFRSADRTTIAQFRVDGFTFNRLQPYTSWNDLYPKVMRLWEQYRQLAAPEFVIRLALRYLNRIPLPALVDDLARFLTVPPAVPPGLPQRITRFLNRVTVVEGDPPLSAHITQSLEPSMDPRLSTLVLDIDAFKEADLEPTDPQIAQVLEQLHDLKNRIFFGLITEDTARMFE